MTKSRNLAKFPKTSAIQVPSGDTAARPSGANGYFRYNTSTSSFEGYSDGNWGAVGGAMYVSANTVSDANNISTGYFGLPAGTTGQRPANTANGYLRYNTTLSSFEGFSSGAWGSIGGSLSSSGLASWNVVSSNYTVGNNIQLLANSAAGTFTITLPASPVLANVVVIADGSGPNTGWSNNNVLVDPNGRTIQGIADNLALNISRSSVSLIYDGATWQVISTTGPKGADGATGNTGSAGVGANATQTNYRFNATNNQTIFVGADAYSQTLSYNVNAVGVYLNGIFLRPTEDYVANNGTTIYLNSGTLANDALDVVSFQSMSLTAAQNTITTFVYTASNNQTSFGGADINGSVLNYNLNNIFVTLNGLTLRNAVDYNQSNSSYLALTSGASANDELSIVAFGSFNLPGTANTISNYFYTANSNQTVFTGNDIYGSPLSYNGGNLIVTRNGSTLRNKIDYTALSGTSVTLTNPAFANDEIGILTFTSFITSANTDYRYLSKITDDVYTANITSTATGYFQVPQGTTAQRPAATSAGLIRYNTSLGSLESANGTAWSNVGSGSASSISGGISWQPVQNTNFIAVSGSGYGVNTAIANVTVTLPASPTVGQQIQIVDYARTFSSNNLIIYANGNKIQGNTANVIISTNGQATALVYYDVNQGWLPYSSGFALGPYYINYLIVGGGGGGSGAGGGGGAGGMLAGALISVTPGTQYTVTVSAGGAGETSGTNSSAFGFTAIGGGKGGNVNNNNAGSGGSGGGGGRTSTVATPGGSGTAGQGNPGGSGNISAPYPAGGGGGAGAAGGTPGTGGATSGAGGTGLTSSLSGASVYYAGGGGGAGDGSSNYAGAGAPGGGGAGGYAVAGTGGSQNTGGGGGGGGGGGSTGGSGIVIVTYTGPVRASGGTITSSGGQTIHTFTTSGTFIA
jgi:hypothetical protein